MEAVYSQKKEDLIGAYENALHYYGGVPAAIVPDNLRSAVRKSSKYELLINETFSDFAEHYSTVVLPQGRTGPKTKHWWKAWSKSFIVASHNLGWSTSSGIM